MLNYACLIILCIKMLKTIMRLKLIVIILNIILCAPDRLNNLRYQNPNMKFNNWNHWYLKQ